MNMPTPFPAAASQSFPPFRGQDSAAALFEYLDRRFSSSCQRFEVKRNSLICCQGTGVQYLYLVKNGEVVLTRGSPDGCETLLTVLGSGEFFGESALLSDTVLTFSASATRQSRLLLIPRRKFKVLLEDPRICRCLLETVAQRCDDAWTQMEVIGCTYAREKVRSGLRWLSGRFGVETRKGVRIDLNQTQLARMVGCARETFSRELNELKRMRAIDVCSENGRKSFYVLDPDSLSESA